MTKKEKELERFRIAYHSINVMVYGDSLIYQIFKGDISDVVSDANDLIKSMKLKLTAKSMSKNTFIIE